jgi:hypothetical protein
MIITNSGEICKKLYPEATVTKATDRDGYYVGVNNKGAFYLNHINIYDSELIEVNVGTGDLVVCKTCGHESFDDRYEEQLVTYTKEAIKLKQVGIENEINAMMNELLKRLN